jgi:hypothetical protein
MHKLLAFYYANAKKELPYYGAGKSSDEIRDTLVNTHLNSDKDLIEFFSDLNDNQDNNKVSVFSKEDELEIGSILNLDEPIFVEDLDEIIHNTVEETNVEGEELVIQESGTKIGQVENDLWDPKAAADEIVNM